MLQRVITVGATLGLLVGLTACSSQTGASSETASDSAESEGPLDDSPATGTDARDPEALQLTVRSFESCEQLRPLFGTALQDFASGDSSVLGSDDADGEHVVTSYRCTFLQPGGSPVHVQGEFLAVDDVEWYTNYGSSSLAAGAERSDFQDGVMGVLHYENGNLGSVNVVTPGGNHGVYFDLNFSHGDPEFTREAIESKIEQLFAMEW